MDFPAGLPLPSQSFRINTEPNVIRTAMDSGAVRQRRRFTIDIAFMNVAWEFTESQMAVFIAWHRYKIGLGTDWFNINLPSGNGFAVHICRFVEGRFDQEYVEGDAWRVGAILEVTARNTMSEAALDVLLASGAY
jgi:hypothetical protein